MFKLTECPNDRNVKINTINPRVFFNVRLLCKVITDACLSSSGNLRGHDFSEPIKVLSSFHAVCSAKTKFFKDNEGLRIHPFIDRGWRSSTVYDDPWWERAFFFFFRFLSSALFFFSFSSLASSPKVAELSDLESNPSKITSVQSHRVMHSFEGSREQLRIVRLSKLMRVELASFYCTS